MSFKDKRTRRICAASASAAVIVAGGVTLGANVASAAGALALSTGSSFTTLDLGAAVAASTTASQQTLQASVAMGAGTDTVTLTYGANSTAGLTAASTAANIQTALNALASITAAGGVTVTRTAGTDLTSTATTYQIVFNTGGARTAIAAASSTGTLAVNSSTGGNTLGSTAGNVPQTVANAVFATKVTTASMAHVHVALDSYTAPSSGTPVPAPALLVNHQAIATATGPASSWESVSVGGTSTQSSSSVTENVFVTANVPGAFKFHLVDDQGTPVATSDDVSSDPLTMTVLDAENVTATTADDWNPTVTAPASVVKGVAVNTTVSFADIATTDARGATTTGGLLGGYVAALTGISSTGGGLGAGPNPATAITYNGTGGYTTVTPSTTATPLVSTATFDRDGSGAPFAVAADGFASPRSASTNVTDNLVTGFTSKATAAVGKVLQTGGAVAVLAGQADVTYTATVTTLSSGTDKSGKDFYFTLTKGTHSPALTADGTLVSTTNTSVVYKATTDSTGVAKLKVTSSVTTTGTDYGISVTTNAVAAAASTATYAVPTAGALQVTSSQSELSPATDGSATIKGQLLDQFNAPYAPQNAEPQQVQVFVGAAGGATPTAPLNGVGTNTATQTVQLTSGAFSYTYKPATPATAGQTSLFAVAYDTNSNGTIANTEPSIGSSINWGSTVAAKTVIWSTPTANLTGVKLATPTNLMVGAGSGQVFGTTAADDGHIKGQLRDATGNPLPFRPVTLSSSGGVYFSTVTSPDTTATPANGLLPTIDVVTDSSGYFTAYAVFTKAGTVTIDAKSGSSSTGPDAEGTVSVTTAAVAAGDAYKVTVSGATALAGANLPVTGTVVDFFGNPVSGATVNLTSSNPAAGSFFAPTTLSDVNGNFNAAFLVASSVDDTTTTVTASLNGPAANFQLPGTNNWPTWGGPKVADGIQSATGKISVVADKVTLNKPKAPVYAGAVTLSGKAKPGAKVTVFSVTGGHTQVASAMASATGAWSAKVNISRTTTYQAETSTAVSGTVLVHVKSTVKVTTKVLSGKHGKSVRVTVSGGPSHSGTVTLWITHGKKVTKVVTHVSGGAKTWTLKPGSGYTTFKATYTSSGCDASSSVSVRVKL